MAAHHLIEYLFMRKLVISSFKILLCEKVLRSDLPTTEKAQPLLLKRVYRIIA
jgi:hypothetical protein